MGLDLDVMAQIQRQKEGEGDGQLPLDAEGADLAEEKRFSLDNPEYIVKTDPLR